MKKADFQEIIKNQYEKKYASHKYEESHLQLGYEDVVTNS